MALGYLLNFPAMAANGDLDTGFGSSGIALTGLSSAYALFPRPVVQPDGRILICSQVNNGGLTGNDIVVARFTADGTLDNSFTSDGLVYIDFNDGDDECAGLALQPDGKIVVAGDTVNSGTTGKDFAAARLNSDGTLDTDLTTGFGAGTGKTTIGFDRGGSNDDAAYGVALQTDGRIVIAGDASTDSHGQDFAVARLNTDGSRDTSGFNLTGKVTVGFNLPGSTTQDDIAFGVAIDAAGNIVLGGGADNGSAGADFAAARLLPDGTLDNNFDADGLVTIGFDLGDPGGSNGDLAEAVLVQGDGKIVLAGQTDSSTTSTPNADMGIVRLNPDGSADSGFGTNGKAVIAFDLTANGSDIARNLLEQSNRKLLLVGYAYTGSSTADAAIVRLNADGSPDAEFGTLGKKHVNLGLASSPVQTFTGAAFQGTQIIASGFSSIDPSGADNFVVRLQNDLIFANGFGRIP